MWFLLFFRFIFFSKPINEQSITTIFSSSTRVSSYSMRAPAMNSVNCAPLRWTIEAQLSRDGSWSVVDDQHSTTDAPTWILAEERSYSIPMSSMLHAFGWRIKFHTVGGGDHVQISRLQWYTEDVTRATTSWPLVCGNAGTSSLSPKGARIVRVSKSKSEKTAKVKESGTRMEALMTGGLAPFSFRFLILLSPSNLFHWHCYGLFYLKHLNKHF